jgi:hypothetical protein
MKRLVLASIGGLAAAAFLALPAVAADKKVESKDKAVQGELLDLACYIGHGESGPDHADCAKECAKGGQPMGLLSADGTVYVLLADHGDSAPFDKAKDLAGKKVEVMGEVSAKAGLKGITVHGVKAL